MAVLKFFYKSINKKYLDITFSNALIFGMFVWYTCGKCLVQFTKCDYFYKVE